MATTLKTKKTTKKTEKTRPEYKYDLKVVRALDGKYGILFDLDINHVRVYGCRVCETRDGKQFIGFPQKADRKESKKFWSVVYAPLTDEQTDEILTQIADLLNADMEDEDEE